MQGIREGLTEEVTLTWVLKNDVTYPSGERHFKHRSCKGTDSGKGLAFYKRSGSDAKVQGRWNEVKEQAT